MRVAVSFALALSAVWCAESARAMELAWTRTTGQFPVDASPVLTRADGRPCMLAVNKGGQVMLWSLDGSDAGPGQDGAVAQLPEGQWLSSPLVLDRSAGPRYVFCSISGLVAALDTDFKELWRYQLPGQTAYAAAIPVLFPIADDDTAGICISDRSGAVTCLNADGSVRWQVKLSQGECRTPLQVLSGEDGQPPALLVAAGSHLMAMDGGGQIVWDADLGAPISGGPVPSRGLDPAFIVCGVEKGPLAAFDVHGKYLWKTPLGVELDSTLVVTRAPKTGQGLILCKGLWGNLYAFGQDGKHLWTHEFRAKSRSKPVIVGGEDPAHWGILLNTYRQQALLFDGDGQLLDLGRLGGAGNCVPLLLPAEAGAGPRALVIAGTLLAHCLEMGPIQSPYGQTPAPGNVTVQWNAGTSTDGKHGLAVDNPTGALLRVNLSMPAEDGSQFIQHRITTQSAFEIPIAMPEGGSAGPIRAVINDAGGAVVTDQTWSPPRREEASAPAKDRLRAWPIPAYATFDAGVLAPAADAAPSDGQAAVSVDHLYVNEIDEGALAVASTYGHPVEARVTVDVPKGKDGVVFGGAVRLFRVVFTGAYNGEDVPDALIALGDAGLVNLDPGRATKVWVQVDGHNAAPGRYAGALKVQPILADSPALELPLTIDVPDLDLGAPLPLKLCTWDYVPNQWFPNRTPEVLDDMSRHGVTIFPRSIGIPPATVDASGQLACDWSAMDAPLAELKGRGQVLFQMTQPPIKFASPPSAEGKRNADIAYLRKWRDHLRELGWNYGDYAFYPVDEPGLANGERIQTFLDAANLFKAADPEFRVYTDPVPGLSLADYQRIAPLVDVWCPNMRLAAGLLAQDPRIADIMKSGKEVWSYECVAQVRSLSPLRYNRANAWRAHFFGLSGIGFWTHCTTQTDPWLRAKDFNEYELVYPGLLPVPSVRWEAARDGLEDVGAVALLEQAVKDARGNPAKAGLVHDAEEELRIAGNDIMELSDAAFIESRDYLRNGDRRIWHTPADVATYRRHRARIAELTLALQAP